MTEDETEVPHTVSIRKIFNHPSTAPAVILDTGGRPFVDFYVRSINPSKDVHVYASIDNTAWRHYVDMDTVTDATTKEVASGFYTGMRYIKIEVDDIGTGQVIIEISASR